MVDLGAGANLGADAETATVGLAEGDKSDVVFQLVDAGAWNGTITFQATLDGTNYVSVLATPSTSGTAAATTTAAGIFRINASGYLAVRAKVTTYAAGSMDVTASVSVDR